MSLLQNSPQKCSALIVHLAIDSRAHCTVVSALWRAADARTMLNGELDAPFVMGVSQHLPQVLDFSTELLDDAMAYNNIIMRGRELNVLLLMGVSQQPPQVLYPNT